MLETAISVVGALGILVVGLLTRAVIAIAILTLFAAPIVLSVYAWVALSSWWQRQAGRDRVGHLRWRQGVYYTPGHLWLRPEGLSRLRVGVDDVAQRVLPDIASVQLSERGTVVKKGDAIGQIRCEDDAVVVLRAPVAGVIGAVNTRVAVLPSLLHRDPYGHGWLVELKPTDREYERFPVNTDAKTWLAREDTRLTRFFEQELGIAAADGGELVLPPHKLLTASQWAAVRAGFLEPA
jgi:glycine cleavage system H lipoate-binding protein